MHDVALDLIAWTALQLQGIVVDVALRHTDKVDLAGEATIVPPVGLEGRDGVGAGGNRRRRRQQNSCRLPAMPRSHRNRRRKTALVVTNMHVIHEDRGAMIGRAKMHEGAHPRLWLVREILLVPKQPLVERRGCRAVSSSRPAPARQAKLRSRIRAGRVPLKWAFFAKPLRFGLSGSLPHPLR